MAYALNLYQLVYSMVMAYLNKLNVHNVDEIVSHVECCIKSQQFISTNDANSSSRFWALLSVVHVKNGEKDRSYS